MLEVRASRRIDEPRELDLNGKQCEMIRSSPLNLLRGVRPIVRPISDRYIHSERAKFTKAINGRTEEENSEGSLILLVYSADFDSGIQRFHPSRLSQLILLS